jgi:hypothetical protein
VISPSTPTDSRLFGISFRIRVFGPDSAFDSMRPYEVADVVCLGCGSAYLKPDTDDIWLDNPGCPCCGYHGWADCSEAPEGHRLSSSRIASRVAELPLL